VTGPAVVTLIVVLLAVDWMAAAILLLANARNPGISALRERAIAALFIAGGSTVVSVIAGNIAHGWGLPGPTRLALLLAALVLASAPADCWIWLFATRRF